MKTLYICSTLEQARQVAEVKKVSHITNNLNNLILHEDNVYYGCDPTKDYEWLFDKVIYVDEINLSQRIHDWAKDKGILEKATPLTQWDKTLEEVMELKEALVAQANNLTTFINSKGEEVNTYEAIQDALGDIRVTIDIQCKMQDTTLEHCSLMAYNIISKRTGKMIDGKFIKDK